MKRRIISILVMVFVLLLLVAACNSSKQVLKQQNISNEVKQAKELEKKSLELDLREVSSEVKIKLWEDVRPVVGHTIDQLIEKFQKKYPNIKVERTHMEAKELRQNTQRSFIVGNGPTLTLSSFDDIRPFSIMGIAQSLDVLMSEEMKNMYVENALPTMTLKGHIYGVPVTMSNLVLFYNKKLVDEVPKNWEELISIAKDLNKDIDNDGKIDQYGLLSPWIEAVWWIAFQDAWVLDKDNNLILDTKATKEALQFVHDLKFKDKILPEKTDYDLMDSLFKEGKGAFIVNWDCSYKNYIEDDDVELGVASLPKFKNIGKYAPSMISGSGYIMLSDLPENKQIATLKFIKFMTGKEAQKILVEKHKLLPTNKSLYDLAIITEDQLMNVSAQQLKTAKPVPVILKRKAVYEAITPVLQSVMAGDLKPAKGATEIQEIAEKIISGM